MRPVIAVVRSAGHAAKAHPVQIVLCHLRIALSLGMLPKTLSLTSQLWRSPDSGTDIGRLPPAVSVQSRSRWRVRVSSLLQPSHGEHDAKRAPIIDACGDIEDDGTDDAQRQINCQHDAKRPEGRITER